MKKITILLTIFASLLSNAAFAQTTARGAAMGRNTGGDEFQWGIALGAAAALGTVVGLTVATAASSPVSYSVKK